MSVGAEVMFCFFCSSRRRHTRCLSDWSSDVCSSDLYAAKQLGYMAIPANRAVRRKHLGKLLRPQFSPFNRLVIWAEESWGVIQVTEFPDRLPANRAALSFIDRKSTRLNS